MNDERVRSKTWLGESLKGFYRMSDTSDTLKKNRPPTFTLTFPWEQIGVLNDVMWEAINSDKADPEELDAYNAMRDEIKRQLDEQWS